MDKTEYDILKAISKKRARKKLIHFIKYTSGDYDAQEFHRQTCEYLDKLLFGEIKKLMIFMPPQHGKSEISSRRFPAHALGQNPDYKIGVCSYSADLASSFNRDIQKIIQSPEYAELYPDTMLSSSVPSSYQVVKGVQNSHIFETLGRKGFVKTVGVEGSLTGTPLDIGIIDDPFKDRKTANSLTKRNSIWEWYQDVFKARLHNDSKELMLFTRWHEDDIAGRILDPDNEYYNEAEANEWTVVVFQALKEDELPIPQAEKIEDNRKIDEALWPSKHSAEKYIRKREINPTGFNSLDQQRPSAKSGNKIKKEWWNIIQKSELPFNPDMISADFFIDGAFTAKSENDETGLGSCYFHKPTGNLYIFNITGLRKELRELLEFMPEYAESNYRNTKSNTFIELKASGHPLKSMLRTKRNGSFNTRGIPDKVVRYGKLNRVENAEPFIASGRVILVNGPWVKAFIEQCSSFPNAKHDDRLDVAMYMIDHYFITNAPDRKKTPKIKR